MVPAAGIEIQSCIVARQVTENRDAKNAEQSENASLLLRRPKF